MSFIHAHMYQEISFIISIYYRLTSLSAVLRIRPHPYIVPSQSVVPNQAHKKSWNWSWKFPHGHCSQLLTGLILISFRLLSRHSLFANTQFLSVNSFPCRQPPGSSHPPPLSTCQKKKTFVGSPMQSFFVRRFIIIHIRYVVRCIIARW